MAAANRMSEHEYAAFVRSAAAGIWELHAGQVVLKPAPQGSRSRVIAGLARQLQPQLDPVEYAVRIGDGHVRGGSDTILIPDVVVVPAAPEPHDVGGLPLYEEPLPLLIEVWTPAVDGYNVDAKIPIYRERGDLEIWLLHPEERSLTTWVRQAAGSYAETIYQVGGEMPAALRGVQLHRETRFDA